MPNRFSLLSRTISLFEETSLPFSTLMLVLCLSSAFRSLPMCNLITSFYRFPCVTTSTQAARFHKVTSY